MTATKAHIKATQKYENKAYFKTLVRFKKEDEERIRAAAGDSLNGFIVKCVLDALDGSTAEEEQQEEAEEPQQKQIFVDVQGFKVPAHIGENGRIEVNSEDLPRIQIKPGKKKSFNIA